MRILLAIHNAFTDSTSGAARSVRTIVEWLVAAGHDCRVLATARFDGIPPNSIDAHLAELDVPIEPARGTPGRSAESPAVQFTLAGVPVTTLLTRHNCLDRPDLAESRQFLNMFDEVVRQFQPELLFTYGGHSVIQESLRRARLRGITTLFTLRRTGYEDPFWFRHVDHVLTASPFLSDHYRRSIGLECTGIEAPIAWSDVLAPSGPHEFVTFVNPSLGKGAAFFARLADMLGSRRPDIPILVVESAMDGRLLGRFREIDLGQYRQIMAGPPTQHPADFFALTKLLLVPSLWDESFGRVAVEALINGIPPLVSDRGSLPATVRGAGRVLPIPAWMTPTNRQLPSDSEVEPWFRAICELCDDPARYAAASALARRTAHEYHAEPVMRRRYVEYFQSLHKQNHNSQEKTTTSGTTHDRSLELVP